MTMTDHQHDSKQATQRPGSTPPRPGVNDYLLAMGHELRAPLNGVIGMSGLLLDGDLTAQQRQYVKSVHSAGECLGAILNDILDLARVASSRLIVEPIPFDLKSMIEETASVLTPRAAERGLGLRVDLRPELPRYVIGDPGRTRQVLGNLVGHAVSATSQGEIVIRVMADGESGEHAWVRFVIEDTGIGISPDRLQRVFDEYVQVDASPYRSFGVTGLGLRLSAELVRLMGGEIGAESTPGKGSRFWFSLPLVIAEPVETRESAGRSLLQGGRALIVEADPTSRSRFVEQFDAAGWDVAFVEDIDRVVGELREGAAIGNPYSACVFSHYAVRPVHAEIAIRLKADPTLAKVALVMITAVGSPGEGKKLWHAGFAAYLRRPVPGEEIREALQVIGRAGPDGRVENLVTRHSLAETRNAQSFAVEGIDQMLASLGTAEGTRRTLVIPIAELGLVSELFDQRGLAADTATSLDHALALLGEGRYECIVLDVRGRADLIGDLKAIRERLAAQGTIPIVAVADAATDTHALIGIGLDEVWTVPVDAEQIDRALARWQDGSQAPEPVTAPSSDTVGTIAAIETAAAEPVTEHSAFIESSAVAAIVELPAPEPAVIEAGPAETVAAKPVTQWFRGVPLFAAPAPAEGPNPVTSAEAPMPAMAEWEVVASADQPAIAAPECGVATAETPAWEAPQAEPPVVEAAVESIVEEPVVAEVAGDMTALPLEAVAEEVAAEVPTAETAAAEEVAVVIVPDVVAAVPLEAAEVVEPAGTETLPPAAAVFSLPTEDAPTTLEGLTDAQWEAHIPVAAIDGFVATESEPASPVADAIIETIDIAPPSVDIVPAEAQVPEAVVEAIALDSFEAGDVPVEAAADFVPTAVAPTQPAIEPVEISLLAAAEPAEAPAHGHDFPAPGETELGLTGNEPSAESWSAPAAPIVEPDPTLDAVSPALLEQALTGGGFFTQYQIASFLREVPSRITDIATAATRGDAGAVTAQLTSLRRLVAAVGSTRIDAVAERMQSLVAADQLEAATALLGGMEHAFLDARQALESASPHGLPNDAPAIGNSFAEQLSPAKEGAARSLAQKLAASFTTDAPKRLADLRLAVADADGDGVQRVAQTFKGMCGLIGAEWLAKLVALAEADARLKRVTQAERYLEHIDLELGRVLATLTRLQA